MKLGNFRRFIETTFGVSELALHQSDSRIDPDIPPARIFKGVLYQAPLKIRSFLELDQQLRTPAGQRIAGGSFSDTTALEALSGWDQEPLIAGSYTVHRRLCQQGNSSWTTLPSGRRIRLAIADGTNQGGHEFSVLSMPLPVYHALDLEPSPGRGHERKTTHRLLLRAAQRLGRGFCTHLAYDALAANRRDFRFVRKVVGAHLLVKIKQEGDRLPALQPVVQAEGLWRVSREEDLRRMGVETVRGLDTGRKVRYEIHAQSGLEWGLPFPLKVARVRETHLKGRFRGQTLAFWILTDDQALSALDAREVAHGRWAIENNGFKELNAQVGSKRGYLRDSRAKEMALRIWMIGMTLFKAFQAQAQKEPDGKNGVRKTKTWLSELVRMELIAETLSGASP